MLQKASTIINSFLSQYMGIRIIRERNVGSDQWHKKQALSAVSVIEKFNGQRLTPKLKRLSDEYSREILGKIEYAPWLYVYSLVRGTFKEGWIPDNYFGNVVLPKINKGLGWATELKSFTETVLKTPYLPDIAYYIDDVFYDRAYNVVDFDFLRKVAGDYAEVFIKKDGTGRGEGVIKAVASELTPRLFQETGNCSVSLRGGPPS